MCVVSYKKWVQRKKYPSKACLPYTQFLGASLSLIMTLIILMGLELNSVCYLFSRRKNYILIYVIGDQNTKYLFACKGT